MICDSCEKYHVFRPVVLYIGSFVLHTQLCTNLPCVRRLGQCQPSRTHHPIGTENSALDSEMFPPTWRLAAWLHG